MLSRWNHARRRFHRKLVIQSGGHRNCLGQSFDTAYDRQRDGRCIEVDGQFRARRRPAVTALVTIDLRWGGVAPGSYRTSQKNSLAVVLVPPKYGLEM